MIRIAVKRPVLTFVVFAILSIFGIFSLLNLKIDLFPKVTLPSISLITFYRGASSEDIEKLVTEPLERVLSTIPNVKNIRSFSQENISTIILEFEQGTNLDAASNDIRDRLDFTLRLLPSGVERPTIFKFDISQFPILQIAIYSDDTLRDIRNEFESYIRTEIERVPGVGQVLLFGGGRKRQINVLVDKSKLEAYNLTLFDIVNIISLNNLSIPAGNIKYGYIDYNIRVDGNIKDPDEIKNIPIIRRDGSIIKISDIAKVEYSYEDKINQIDVMGKNALFLGIFKQADANAVDVGNRVKQKLSEISKRYNLKYVIAADFSKNVENSINNLTKEALFAATFVILVTFLILRNITASTIISIAIPTSIVVAFIYLYLSGTTINIISLTALALAVGLVVDDAIVVMENIFYHREKGENPISASIFATEEVSQAVIASTITRVAVVLPLLLAGGFVGLFFKELVFSIGVVLLTSLFVSFTLTPMLASKFLRNPKPPTTKIGRLLESFLNALENGHKNLLKWSVNHKFLAISISILIFILGFSVFRFVKTEFIPEIDTGEIRITVLLPSGTKLEKTIEVMEKFKNIVKSNPNVESYFFRAGPTESGFGSITGLVEESNFFGAFIQLKKDRDKSTKDIAKELEIEFKKIPGPQAVEVITGNITGQILFGGGKPISIQILGDDIEKTDSIANLIKEKVEKIDGIIGTTISRQSSNPEIKISFDKNKLAKHGITISQAGSYIRNALIGSAATSVKMEGLDINVLVRLDEDYRNNIAILNNLQLPSPFGYSVYLSDIAKIEYGYGPLVIERLNKRRIVKVESDYFKRALNEIIRDVEKAISEIKPPPGIDIKISGSFERQRESFGQLFIALILGIALIYLVMAGQLGSFLYPAIIMLSVPFSFVGVALIFAITQFPLSVNGFVGIILVTGIVLSNAILMTDYMNILKSRGYDLISAVIEGASRRLRPILITTLTVIFGALPLALSKGEGAEQFKPLAIAIIGGLTFSTIITLFFIPTVYSVFEAIKLRRKK
ncbi:MAG: efflux RND transporter permease subunit [candidate division WOR-3 bacterium]|nr:efflux RND transporter permease subunit [candidate division WOR-3 bacterium]